jgi:bifunctional enzyme CysN/CysC
MNSSKEKEIKFNKEKDDEREAMNVVIVGHVDHGKSTLVGRLLADTNTLPDGKLEAVKLSCEKNSRPFEYAFLLDALKDEQSQGITIDTARCFFKSDKRDYIIIDAPGHIEFLKNMITGAARAEAAMLVIDADEGIKENSKRHGYMMSFLGIKNINICVNKMDLVNYDEKVFNNIVQKYSEFLKEINLKPMNFIPISAREGDNIVKLSKKTAWYKGVTILEAFDEFKKAAPNYERSARLPIQDIYKVTKEKDDRRIFSGRIESGTFNVGDDIVFLPSNKKSKIKSIENFNTEVKKETFAGQSTGVCIDTQIYVKPGEILCKTKEKLPHVSTKFKANIFWMGKQPLVKQKNYKLKLASQQVPVILSEILSVLDASELSSIGNKPQVDRHDVAECIFETLKPIAFDEVTSISETGRFVIVDSYEIAGGGIILAPVFEEKTSLKEHIKDREFSWERSNITPSKRSLKYEHKSALVIITGQHEEKNKETAKMLEEELFKAGKFTYFLGISENILNAQSSTSNKTITKLQHIQQLGEMSHILTDSGLILIANVSEIDSFELQILKSLNRPNKTIVINIGDLIFDENSVDLTLDVDEDVTTKTERVIQLLNKTLLLDPEFLI